MNIRKDIDTEVVVNLYLNGEIPANIAKRFNCSGAMIRDRLGKAGVYKKKPTPKKAAHGTRTMYNHGCRCDACCRAEHQQYLKREKTKKRKRMRSKWSDETLSSPYVKGEAERKSYAARRDALKRCEKELGRLICWQDLFDAFGGRCAICGCSVDPDDWYYNKNSRLCFGRKYPTVDHIISIKNGGNDTFENTQLACKHCNSSKGIKAMSEVTTHAEEQAITNKCA